LGGYLSDVLGEDNRPVGGREKGFGVELIADEYDDREIFLQIPLHMGIEVGELIGIDGEDDYRGAATGRCVKRYTVAARRGLL